MKTTIYIDGFNLYYGVLRGTQYKWLDVVSLFSSLSKEQNPDSEVTQVKFFTAPIKARLSTRQQQAVTSQRIYIKALENKYPDVFECIEGFHQISKGTFPKYQDPIDKTDKVSVWRLEEKQTDVHIGTMMYRDVAMSDVQQIVLCSNDSDMLPALRFIRSDFPKIKIGLVFPAKSEIFSRELDACSDWTRKSIAEEELAKFQLPAQIATHKKPIKKPSYW